MIQNHENPLENGVHSSAWQISGLKNMLHYCKRGTVSLYPIEMEYCNPQKYGMAFRLDGPALGYVGDPVRVILTRTDTVGGGNCEAYLRTNLLMGRVMDRQILDAYEGEYRENSGIWRDYPMELVSEVTCEGDRMRQWAFEVMPGGKGYFWAKPYIVDHDQNQHWPDGPNLTLHVHSNTWRRGNTMYCAWPRLMDAGRSLEVRRLASQESEWRQLEQNDMWVQPRSGTFRELVRELPHIMGTLGCRIVHLMPVNPVPYTDTRLGRMGSPYAATSLVDLDPAQVEFDRGSTGLEQFEELVSAVHQRGGRIIIDLVINHTGWGSQLFENHPEFFHRRADGSFVSPRAWGTVWEDLVALNHRMREQTYALTEAFLTWCRRGVDGFRCDAGYQVPTHIWRYITTRVRMDFPHALFFLEGLGGALEDTQALLQEGGMHWAYSELFQNESHHQIAEYPNYSHKMSLNVGCFVHYSETHDNNRLASRGRQWSVFRNKLCAALSDSGAYGITSGVEWLATEKISVHNKSGLRWGHSDNIVPIIARINNVLCHHAAFRDGVRLERLTGSGQPVQVWRRVHRGDQAHPGAWVVANNDQHHAHQVHINHFSLRLYLSMEDLFGEAKPEPQAVEAGEFFDLLIPPGSVYVFSPVPVSSDADDEDHRLTDHLMDVIYMQSPLTVRKPVSVREICDLFRKNPDRFLEVTQQMTEADWQSPKWLERFQESARVSRYDRCVTWRVRDSHREFILPENHWLRLEHTSPFRAEIRWKSSGNTTSRWIESVPMDRHRHTFCMPPGDMASAEISGLTICMVPHGEFYRHGTRGEILFARSAFSGLGQLSGPVFDCQSPESPCVLLTNSRGGMAMVRIDMGSIDSKYDCVLGANMHPRLPVDRHVFAKRLRFWGLCEHRVVELNRYNLRDFRWGSGRAAQWIFQMDDGVDPIVEIMVRMVMDPGLNTVRVQSKIHRWYVDPEVAGPIRLNCRVDMEDRSFHSQTHLNNEAVSYFARHTHALSGDQDRVGFQFAPASDRHLAVWSRGAEFHMYGESVLGISHSVEASRGQEGSGDAWSPGWFQFHLSQDVPVELVLTSELEWNAEEPGVGQRGLEVQVHEAEDDFQACLHEALKDFVVRRDDGWTVIAGYPWFLDWGRDTLIVARGMVAAGMHEELLGILRNYGRYEDSGTLPNTIHGGDLSNRHTSDAPLWYGVACEDLVQSGFTGVYETEVEPGGRTVLDVLHSIAHGYRTGTPAGMRMDPESGLIWSPSHFTWMDTNFPAGTPREGYPIEIQILWHRLLCHLHRLTGDTQWLTLAAQVADSVDRLFWREDLGYYADLLVCGAHGHASRATQDSSLRSNQILAVALGFVSGQKAKRSVEQTGRYLVVPGGLRSLAPLTPEHPHSIYSNDGFLLNNPNSPYWPRYAGDEDTRRKPAYHNGTAWTWTFPGFCESLARAHDFSPESVQAARSYLFTIEKILRRGCFGQIPEVMDGDFPHTQRGCPAQAWGASEFLRVSKLLSGYN